MNRRMEPPEVRYPDPECRVCGSLEVTQESMEDGAPLCEDHDTPIARKRFPIEEQLHDLGEGKAQISQELHREMPRQKAQALMDRMADMGEKRSKLRARKSDLQDECDHDRVDIEVSVVTEPDLEQIPEDEHPDEIPVWMFHIDCWECGLSDLYSPSW